MKYEAAWRKSNQEMGNPEPSPNVLIPCKEIMDAVQRVEGGRYLRRQQMLKVYSSPWWKPG
jgi:hypothetical protein